MKIQSNKFEEWLLNKQLSQQTLKLYTFYLKRLNLLAELNQETINQFIAQNRNNVCRAFLKNLISYYKLNPAMSIEDGLNIETIRALEIPQITGRKKVTIPKILTRKEIYMLEDRMKEERHKLMLLISFEAGLRVGELISITPVSINFQKFSEDTTKIGEILVKGKGNKEGIAFIPPELMIRLYKWISSITILEEEKDKCVWKMKIRTWQSVLAVASQKLFGRSINTHLLRHSRSVELMDKEMDIKSIQEFLRHTSINSTQIYLHTSKEKLERDIMKTYQTN